MRMMMMRGRRHLKGNEKSGSRALIPLGAILGGLWAGAKSQLKFFTVGGQL